MDPTARLRHYLEKIAFERNFETCPESLLRVQSFIKETFTGLGYTVQEDPFFYRGRTFTNLIASLDPEDPRPRWIFAAHFDSVSGSPGADDNATGVAALLEAARTFAEFKQKQTTPLPCRVEFAAFNLEEYGMIGSRAYAKKLKKKRAEVRGMFSLEMVGYAAHSAGSQKMPVVLKAFYPDVGNFIALVSNTSSKSLLDKTKKIFKTVAGLGTQTLILPANGWILPDARLSDHSPFWDEGFPALLVTDTSFYRNPYYHTQEDKIEILDLDFLGKVTEAVSKTACLLALASDGRGTVRARTNLA